MGWVYDATPEVNNASHYPYIIGVSSAFCICMLIAVIARIVLRRRILGWDDVIIVTTAAWSTAFVIMAIVQTRYGLGLPLDRRPDSTEEHFRLLSYAGKPLYFVALAGYKLALCAGYLRFTKGSGLKKYRRLIIGMAVFVAVSHLVFILVTLLECIPVQKTFHPNLPGSCLNFLDTQYTIVAISIFCDVAIFLLPIPLFLSLAWHRKAALGLSFLFACGLLTTVCSIVRATYLKEVGPSGTGDNSMVVLFCAIETNVGIVMSCLPFLRAFFKGMMDRSGSPRRPPYQYQPYNFTWPHSTQTRSSIHATPQSTSDKTNSSIAKPTKAHSAIYSGSAEDILLDHTGSGHQELGIMKQTGYSVHEERI